MPAQGASSSQQSRKLTTRSVAELAAYRLEHLAGEARAIGAVGVHTLVGQAGVELPEEREGADVDLDAVEARIDRERAAAANPATSEPSSAASISIGISRLTTSATREGAQSTDWE